VDIYNDMKTKNMKNVSSNPRPHSKTVAIANGIKTRMHCDHLNPRCSCGKRVKQNKKEHGANVYATPKQKLSVQANTKSRNDVSSTASFNKNFSVPSVRVNPRGGKDRRKHYDTIENDPPTNIVEEDWNARRNDYSFNNDNNSTNYKQLAIDSRKLIADSKRLAKDSKRFIQETKPQPHIFNSKESIGERNKKSVKFADTIEEVRLTRPRSRSDECVSDPSHDYLSSRGSTRASRYAYYENLNQKERCNSLRSPNSHNTYINNCTTCTSHSHKHKKSCNCDENDPELEELQRRFNNLRESSIPDPCFMCERNPDFLCRHFGNTCHSHEQRLSSCSPHKSRENIYSHRNDPINDCGRHSIRSNNSYNDDKFVREPIIPYEPRTDIVRDLKKKLEDEYQENNIYRNHSPYRGIHSWDTDDLENLKNYRKFKGKDNNLELPRHRCSHHYIQNDRLFLEPSKTDSLGRSLCRECGTPQPHNPHEDPYLYHIHLGDFKDPSLNYEYNQDRHRKNVHINSHIKEMDNYQSRSFKNPPGILKQNGRRSNSLDDPRLDDNKYKLQSDDTTKNLYANKDTENDIYPRKFRFIDRCRTSDELRYQNNSSYGRHHKTSMALRDHLFNHRL
ncbi:unnamed protein product, partial [Meganyctiphanes norvegica]